MFKLRHDILPGRVVSADDNQVVSRSKGDVSNRPGRGAIRNARRPPDAVQVTCTTPPLSVAVPLMRKVAAEVDTVVNSGNVIQASQQSYPSGSDLAKGSAEQKVFPPQAFRPRRQSGRSDGPGIAGGSQRCHPGASSRAADNTDT